MIASMLPEKEEKIGESNESVELSNFRKRYKIKFNDQMVIYNKLCENPVISSPELLKEVGEIGISVSQLNRIRQDWKLSRKQGRPRKKKEK